MGPPPSLKIAHIAWVMCGASNHVKGYWIRLSHRLPADSDSSETASRRRCQPCGRALAVPKSLQILFFIPKMVWAMPSSPFQISGPQRASYASSRTSRLSSRHILSFKPAVETDSSHIRRELRACDEVVGVNERVYGTVHTENGPCDRGELYNSDRRSWISLRIPVSGQ